MINRRDFLRRAAIVATGIIAADQLELLERLTWKQKWFPGADFKNYVMDYNGQFKLIAGEDVEVGDLLSAGPSGKMWKVDAFRPTNTLFVVKHVDPAGWISGSFRHR